MGNYLPKIPATRSAGIANAQPTAPPINHFAGPDSEPPPNIGELLPPHHDGLDI